MIMFMLCRWRASTLSSFSEFHFSFVALDWANRDVVLFLASGFVVVFAKPGTGLTKTTTKEYTTRREWMRNISSTFEE